MSVKPIPDGYHTITPQLSIEDAAGAIEFYKKAFGAEEIDRAMDPSGQKVWHCAMRIGSSMLFVNGVFPGMGGGQSQSDMWLYVPDVEASFKRAVDAGCKVALPPTDMFWGDRMTNLADPFGQKWTIASRTKDMTKDEIAKAAEEFAKSQK
jgi:PhnB protein